MFLQLEKFLVKIEAFAKPPRRLRSETSFRVRQNFLKMLRHLSKHLQCRDSPWPRLPTRQRLLRTRRRTVRRDRKSSIGIIFILTQKYLRRGDHARTIAVRMGRARRSRIGGRFEESQM